MKQLPLKGKLVDEETRCEHYQTPQDIIAIKFDCCDTYYPCFKCHDECADHPRTRWPKEKFDEKAVLCGVCKHELTVNEYLKSGYECPSCKSRFNEGCRLHYDVYFEEID
ncbi:CHY zinc finger protein [Pseudalkalibacillus caeni]|uniref:CHY-type domain-containing protein n=1 Tax=Exobacillus caeni TaxID=2574798 RepID=A0A5R9F2J9_9BACL|nr:CHY zinc finger protein [Pseudalkalibacillus caeni]TLS36536.1 hypothetical protein FCL54_15095 [Pseudalkalibacillus caeni]